MTLGLKVSPELKKNLEQLADQENRSLSNWILNAIITYAKEHRGVDLKNAESKTKKQTTHYQKKPSETCSRSMKKAPENLNLMVDNDGSPFMTLRGSFLFLFTEALKFLKFFSALTCTKA